ncbi:MAG: hypothetical protein ACXWAT_00590 [Methylobacter sp.]
MRRPAVNKPSARQQVSNFISYPAPIGGWNAIDPLADMQPSEAITLDNWYPRPGYCEIRGGSAVYASGMTGLSKTLAVYNGITGANKMFCATNTGVYDVSVAGAVGASVAARTNGKHQTIMFGDGTSDWLIMVNGVDKPLYYDGTTWTAVDGTTSPALTGLTTTSIVGVCIHKGRLIFLQNNSMAFWYLAAGAAGGALTKFDLSGVAQRGGYIMAAASWTVDAGNGPDDRLVFITSQGELIIYQGTNPSSAGTWALVGVYRIGNPLGRRCTMKLGSDLVILTQNGAFTLSTVLTETGTNNAKAASQKIGNAFNASALSYGANFGWKAIPYPTQGAVIVNIPLAEDGIHHQYVMNTVTGAWCRFIGWDAEDFAVFNDELYYCQATNVIKAWSGHSDQGANIAAYAKTAFSYFNSRGQLKQFKMFRPMLAVNGTLNFLVDIDVDFEDTEVYGVANYTVSSAGLWDVSNWDQSYWAAGLQIIKEWSSPNAWAGYCAAGKLKIGTTSLEVQWMATDYVFEDGNGL